MHVMTTSECPPLAQRITKSLLGYGVIAGPFYILIVVAQELIRPGFDPTRHEASLLANGTWGWIQIANFVITGAMTIAAAVGVRRAMGAGLAGWLLGVYGLGLVGAGIFVADPSNGFPPGAPPGRGPVSWHGMLHFVCAGVGFVCLTAACFVMAARLARDGERGWAWGSGAVGALFAAGFASVATGAKGADVLLLFTAVVVVVWVWLTAISVKLYRRVG